MDTKLKQRINQWLNPPFDPKTQESIQNLIKENPKELEDAFFTDLSFGTAGLRGIMGVGTNRMNCYTIRKTTQGLALYLKSQFQSSRISVVIGFDSRHHSEEFAKEAANVLSHYGIEVFLISELRPTPYVSFACRHLKANAAIMITASHNPKEYNGYKVYWQDGAQVVHPHDVGIMNSIEEIKEFSAPLTPQTNLIKSLGNSLDQEYLKAISPLQLSPEDNKLFGEKLKIVYTSLHGTGITLAPEALKSWGFRSISYVEKQIVPNGDFPTVKFPNPEYPEALKLGIELLESSQSDLLLATDPDADRIGVVVRHQDKSILLTGNEIACLCAEYLCSNLQRRTPNLPHPAIITTVVSSELLSSICLAYQIPCLRLLTGFKYIGEKIEEWQQNKTQDFLFGAEESYGYLLGTHARDKDAIVSSCLIAEMSLFLKRQGKTLIDFLEEIYKKYGIFREAQISLEFSPGKEGMESMKRFMLSLRKNPPLEFFGRKIIKQEDYEMGIHKLPPSDMLLFQLEGGIRLIIRPSGTEPKIKIYGGIHLFASHEILKKGIEEADKMLSSFLKEFKASIS